MIRSTKTSLKFANTNKQNQLSEFINEYTRVSHILIDHYWQFHLDNKIIPKKISSTTLKFIDSWLSARALQAAAQQAGGIIRSAITKSKRREFIYNKLLKENKIKEAQRLLKIINETKITKPQIKSLQPQLDKRFAIIELENNTSFDGWLILKSLGNKLKIVLPFKRTKHFNKLFKNGSLKTSIRLSNKEVTFNFEIQEKLQISGQTLGVDIGINKTISVSNGFQSQQDKHGWDLTNIQQKLARKKKGSKAFKRAQAHRINYINWSINKLNLKGVKEVRLEKIKNLRFKRCTNRFMTHWTYKSIFDKLRLNCEQYGVRVTQVDPAFTSQRCSSCGWTRRINRSGVHFKCSKCGFTADADLNAARNISLDLPLVDRLKSDRSGFYWVLGQEFTVPAVG